MVNKAVCVLKGTGEVTGTVHFEQEVKNKRKDVFVAAFVLTFAWEQHASLQLRRAACYICAPSFSRSRFSLTCFWSCMGLTLAVLISCTRWWPNLILNYSGLLYTISLVDWLLYNATLHKRVKSSSAMTFDTIAGLRLIWAPVRSAHPC